MTDMTERVARAIRKADYNDFEIEKNMVPVWGYLDHARAAIAAMRDCTPAMLDAGSAAHPAGGYVRSTLLTDIIEAEWRAMVDAALEEPQNNS
jgi:hypothetical protein